MLCSATQAELNLDQNSFSQAERGAAYALHLEAVWESKNRQYDYDKQQRAKEKAAAEGESQYRSVHRRLAPQCGACVWPACAR